MNTNGRSEDQARDESPKEPESQEMVEGGFVRDLDEYSFRSQAP